MGMQCTPIANTRPLLIGVCPPVGDHKKGRFDRMKEITNRSQPQPTLSFQCHKQGYRMTVPLPDKDSGSGDFLNSARSFRTWKWRFWEQSRGVDLTGLP
jgi:hypothetical protein